jgi:tetratricopeptide (TPR) repeat protein
LVSRLSGPPGEHREAVKLVQRGMALARDRGLTYFLPRYTVSVCHTYALSRQMAECLPLLDRAVDALRKLANPSDQSGLLLIVGDACVLADRVAGAIAIAERALTVARDRGQRAHETRALRLLGDVAARRDCLQQAESRYRDALPLAEELGVSAAAIGFGLSVLQ